MPPESQPIGRFKHHLTIPMDPAANAWLKDLGAGSKRAGLRKTAVFRLIDLSISLAKESLNQPIDFLEPWELDAATAALSEYRLEDADLSKTWIHVLDTNEALAQKLRALDPYQTIRLIFHVINARK